MKTRMGCEMISQNYGRRSGPLLSWEVVEEKREREIKIREEYDLSVFN